MDHFGIGAEMESMVRVCCQSARRTGRTTAMVESLSSGDRIIFTNKQEADMVRRLARDVGKEIECVVASPSDITRLMDRRLGKGRTIFDHSWVEDYYMHVITKGRKEIDFFQHRLSGSTDPTPETRQREIEISKWKY